MDPALVHHYFGSKDDLFVAALQLPIDPRQIVDRVFAEGIDGAAERLLRIFFSVWDDPELRLPLVAMVRAAVTGEGEPSLFEEALPRLIFSPVADALGIEGAERRAQLVSTQIIGLIVGRYILQVEPLASMPAEDLIAWIAPTIQRYLTADLPPR